jgi:hypothetical protein
METYVNKRLSMAPANLPVGFTPAQATVEGAPANDSLSRIARELFWWEEPEAALENPRRFLAQVMSLGTWDHLQIVKKFFGWDQFKDALVNAEPGWFDARSWALWHNAFGLSIRPMPKRSLT